MKIHNCTILTNAASKIEMPLKESEGFQGNIILTQKQYDDAFKTDLKVDHDPRR